jgi:hypothetical protein
MFAFGGIGAASRLILAVCHRGHTDDRFQSTDRGALQWHASRSGYPRKKRIDLMSLIGYNLSNWTGLGKRAIAWGLPSV